MLSDDEIRGEWTTIEAWTYRQVVFASRGLTNGRRKISIDDLGTLPWAVLEGQGYFRRFLEETARGNGSNLNVAVECSSYAQIAVAVATGRYAGFLPEFARSVFANSTEIIERQTECELQHVRKLVFAWRENVIRTRPIVAQTIESISKQISDSI